MGKYLILLVLAFAAINATAQTNDSVFAARKGAKLAIIYVTKPGETVAMLANRFYVPEEKIEVLNSIDGRKRLTPGTSLFIPLDADNFQGSREPSGIENHERLYYKVHEHDDIPLISIYAGLKKDELILWNNLRGNSLKEGQPLFVGWVKLVPKDSINIANGIAYPSRLRLPTAPDTARHAYGELDSLYNAQTRNGTNTISEKGTVAFFEKVSKKNVFYAFHNTTARGTVIKVTDLGTGKYIFAKVIGPIPDTKLYANSILGLSSGAKDALGVTDSKLWCELSYSPNQ